MKKLLLTICLATFCLATFAQTADKPVTFGIKGGINFSRFSYNLGSLQDVSYSSDLLTGFQAGAFVDFKVGKSVSVQPALLYSVKGANINSGGLISDMDTKRTVNYLHLPVNILYHLPVGKHELHFGGGPFISYALSGRSKGTLAIVEEQGDSRTTTTFDEKLEFSDTANGMKRLDAGVGLLAGFKLSNGLLIDVNYDFGLANIEYGRPTTQTRVLALSVGYAF